MQPRHPPSRPPYSPRSRNARIYVVNETDDDLAPAADWGELRYVNPRPGRRSYIYPDHIQDGGLPAYVMEQMEDRAHEFRPDRDFLLIVGDHLQLIAFTAMLAARYSHFRVLRWDRNQCVYYPVRIDSHISALIFNVPA